jgi:hypothetical protein
MSSSEEQQQQQQQQQHQKAPPNAIRDRKRAMAVETRRRKRLTREAIDAAAADILTETGAPQGRSGISNGARKM